LNQVCLIRETKNTRSVGVPPGTGLGNTAIVNPRDDKGISATGKVNIGRNLAIFLRWKKYVFTLNKRIK